MKKFCLLLFMLNGLAYANNLDQFKSACENETDPDKKEVLCKTYEQMLHGQKLIDAADTTNTEKVN